jgi:signal transduction histidine kinase
VPAALAPARANPEKLQRVLFNLIQNAIRHTPADGSVVVRAETVADQIEIEVADSGDGIAVADRERVFTPFYRAGADAARTAGGAGLGLAVSRAIVEAHGGRIWLADCTAGTRVRFSVPVAGRPHPAPAAKH